MKIKQAFLRNVNQNDVELLYGWRNDEEVRKNSFSEEVIEFKTHSSWFDKTLCREDVFLYILVDCGNNVGQIRLNVENKIGIISYSIDKRYRNNGYGTKILQLVEDKIISGDIGVTELQGLVKISNIASQKAFEKMGYKKEETDFITYTKILNI